MKKISAICLAMLLTACVSSPKTSSTSEVVASEVVLKACADKRPKVCTREYLPVCGFNDSGKKIKSYGNACSACADSKVLGHTLGECK